MKRKILFLFAITVGLFFASFSVNMAVGQTTEKPAHQHTTKYTCPMHPEVISDKPGNCSKCGMKLVEKKDSKNDMKSDTVKMQKHNHMKHDTTSKSCNHMGL